MTVDEKAKAREAFEAALSRFYSVFVLVGKHPALIVPRAHSPENGRLVLEYGLDLRKPIPDLEATEDGIKATLSFACEPVATFVPWEAVRAMEARGERPRQRAKLRAV
jgi:hypothetical protein